MDLKYTVNSIEKQDSIASEQLENTRQLDLYRLHFFYSRMYNLHTIRPALAPYNPTDQDSIVLLNYIFNEEKEHINKFELAELDHIVNDDIVRHDIHKFQINNL